MGYNALLVKVILLKALLSLTVLSIDASVFSVVLEGVDLVLSALVFLGVSKAGWLDLFGLLPFKEFFFPRLFFGV